jgi:hypothetical protein
VEFCNSWRTRIRCLNEHDFLVTDCLRDLSETMIYLGALLIP